MRRKLFGAVAIAALVAGGAIVAVAGPAAAGDDDYKYDLVECDPAFYPEPEVHAGVGAAAISGEAAWCAELTVAKTVEGDDPGVEFPVEVTCEVADRFTRLLVGAPGAGGPDADLNPDEGDPDSTTVELADGEDESLLVPVLFGYSDVNGYGSLNDVYPIYVFQAVDCEVDEDVSDADLPAGWSCDADVDPDEVTLGPSVDEVQVPAGWPSDMEQEETVEVTNTCTAPVTTTAAPAPTQPAVPAAAVAARARFTG